jgi:hypothetical protein
MIERRRPYRLPFDLSFALPARQLVRSHLGVSNASQAFDLDFEHIDLLNDESASSGASDKAFVEGESSPWSSPLVGRMMSIVDRIHAAQRLAVGSVSLGDEGAMHKNDLHSDPRVALSREFAIAGTDVIRLIDHTHIATDAQAWRAHARGVVGVMVDGIRNSQHQSTVVLYYCEGNMSGIIEDLVDLGVDIVGPVSERMTPIEALSNRYLANIGFWGGIEGDLLTGRLHSSQIDRRLKNLAGLARDGASIVVAPDKLLDASISWENVRHLTRLVQSARL